MSDRPAVRIVEAVAGEMWAITEPMLETILAVCDRLGEGPEALEQRLGRPLDNTHATTVRNGVAIVPVVGPIVRYAGLFSRISGATSIDALAMDLRQAADRQDISAVLLSIDSPGGQMAGINELAKQVRALRGVKPVTAYVGGQAASGAYWIASAADRIVVDDTALLGSIGVVTTLRIGPKVDVTGARQIEFVSSQSPGKRPDLDTAEGRGQVQMLVDQLAGVFVEAVASNRNVSASTVLEQFGRGGVLVGRGAVAAGMADAIGTFEDVLAQLAGRADGTSARPGGVRDASIVVSAIVPEPRGIAGYLQLIEAARMQPLAGDAHRAAAISLLPAQPDVPPQGERTMQQATITEEALRSAWNADAALRAEFRGNFEAYGAYERGRARRKGIGAPPPPGKPDAHDAEASARAEWDRDAGVRAEFGSIDAFLAYSRARTRGQVREIGRPGR